MHRDKLECVSVWCACLVPMQTVRTLVDLFEVVAADKPKPDDRPANNKPQTRTQRELQSIHLDASTAKGMGMDDEGSKVHTNSDPHHIGYLDTLAGQDMLVRTSVFRTCRESL